MVTAEIISIGDELLIGQTINTNAAWMGEQLSLVGIKVLRGMTIADTREEIIRAIDASEADIVLMTGGLGPTRDDITKHTLCEYFDAKLVMNQEVLDGIEAFFSKFNKEMLDMNRDQAMLPDKCTVLVNEVGTASGMWFRQDNRVFVSMPGVPFEMRWLMNNHVLPKVKALFKPGTIVHKTIMTHGIGESFLAEIIQDWEASLYENGMSLAYLPSPGIVRLRLTAHGTNEQALRAKVEAYAEAVKPLANKYIYGYDGDTLEAVVGGMLANAGSTLATAESCTGGYIGHLITSVPGSSSYYMGSIISYANEVKMAQLGVQESHLREFGAVSEPVVRQMAKGAREKLGTTYAISTSGVAGPDGGTEEKPVGTVWIAVAGPDEVVSKKFTFGNNRERNIRRSALAGLGMLRRLILRE